MDASSALQLFLLALLFLWSDARKEYVVDQEEINSIGGEFYPYCVEVIDVVPPPRSVLEPKPDEIPPNRRNYNITAFAFRITFSRPVILTHNDTTAGWQPEIANLERVGASNTELISNILFERTGYTLRNIPPLFLSPSRSYVDRYYPYKIASWGGSSREIIAYFNVPTAPKGQNIGLPG